MNRSVKLQLALIFASVFLLSIILIMLSYAVVGGADNYVHYYIARYAVENPILFFNHWGKPVYTLLIFPVAQMGFNAVHVFMIILSLLTSFVIYLLCKKLQIKNPVLVVLIVLFTPIFFSLSQSILTEIAFAFVLSISIYFFANGKYVFAAIILSFLPFVRNEAIVLFPVFMLAFVLRKRYWHTLLFFTGFVAYSIIGSFFYNNDLLWLINEFPYRGAESIYGSGSLFHFVNHFNKIFGYPLTILFLVGLIVFLGNAINRKYTWDQLIIFLLILFSFLAYFVAHSFAWYLGKGGSLGLIRVMAAVTPLIAVFSLLGFNAIIQIFKRKNAAVVIAKVLLLSLIIIWPFLVFDYPVKGRTEKIVEEAAEWVKHNKSRKSTVYLFDPLLPFHLEDNPYDTAKIYWMGHILTPDLGRMKYGDYLIWDAHFGFNEGGTEFETLIRDQELKLIKSYYPEEIYIALGGNPYSIQVFKKVKETPDSNNIQNYLLYLEDFDEGDETVFAKDTVSYSGNRSCLVDSDTEFLLKKEFIFEDSIRQDLVYHLKPSLMVNINEDLDGKNSFLVTEIFDKNSPESKYFYISQKLNAKDKPAEWTLITDSIIITPYLLRNARIKNYIWNPGKNDFLIDDYKMELIAIPKNQTPQP